jgi:hypothetical protein
LAMNNGWLHHLEFSLRYGIGLPLLVAGTAGVVFVAAREPAMATLLFTFPAAYFVVAGSMRLLFFRYVIPIVPFLCLAAARLVCSAAAYATGSAGIRPRWRPVLFGTFAAVAAVLLTWPSLVNVWQFDRVIRQTDNRVVVARWFEQYVPAGDSVLQSGSRYGHAQFDRRLGYQEWAWDGARGEFRLGRNAATGRPEWILLQESPLPSTTQEIVKQFLEHDYQRVFEFHAANLGGNLLYDLQDAFFVPVTGLESVTRPGPNFVLFKRTPAGATYARAADTISR